MSDDAGRESHDRAVHRDYLTREEQVALAEVYSESVQDVPITLREAAGASSYSVRPAGVIRCRSARGRDPEASPC